MPVRSIAAVAAAALDDVAAVELRRVAMPMRRAHVAAHGAESIRDLVVVGVVGADGAEGWGECSTLGRPGYSHEHTAGAWDRLRTSLVPALLKHSLAPALAAGEVLDPAHPMASASVEAALVDLGLRRQQRSLSTALGATTDRVARCVVVGLDDADGSDGPDDASRLVEEVAAAVAGGASMVKLKASPRRGATAVAAVRQAYPSLAVAVDANGSLADSPAVLDALAELDLAYLEQPFPPGHRAAVGAVARLGVAVALDETAVSPEAITAAVEAGEGSIVNLKPARVGGIMAAVRCWDAAVAAGADVFVGGMLESAVGRAAALGLAAAVASGTGGLPTGPLPTGPLPTDLGPSTQYFDDDIAGPIVTAADGSLLVPQGFGVGVIPDPEALAAVTVAHWTSS